MHIDSPFFIIGTKRSGTTLLRLMLNAHSRLSIPIESHFIIDLLKKFKPEDKLNSHDFDKALTIIESHPRFVSWNIGQNDLLELKEKISFPITLPEFITKIFELQINDVSVNWGDKTPEYVDIVPQLKTMFPQSKFLVILRDGRDVANSLKNRGWHGWSVYQRARYWNDCIQKMFVLEDSDRSLFIKYEDLIKDTPKTLQQICGFLGKIDFEESMMDFNRDYKYNITEVEKKAGLHTKLARKPKIKDIDKWKKDSTLFEIWAFECVAHKALDRCGYEVSGFHDNKLMHRIGAFFYRVFGKVLSLIYGIYHYVLPKSFKSNLRQSKLYLKTRKLIREM